MPRSSRGSGTWVDAGLGHSVEICAEAHHPVSFPDLDREAGSGRTHGGSQLEGEQVRVTGKKRDDLQTLISTLKQADFDLPLQFTNFRD